MNSRIYKGWVRHRRVAPSSHGFRYRLFMLYLDLAELPHLFDGVPFWSARRRAPAWFKRSDYLGPDDVPLDTAVRDLVEARTGTRPRGPVRLLTHLRYFGYCMNPVSFYYCFDAAGMNVETIVAEITNTPWKERHQYVLPIADRDPGAASDPGAACNPIAACNPSAAREPGAAHRSRARFTFQKDFHVSPFMPMNMMYRWSFSEPARHLAVHMQNLDNGRQVFDATLSLRAGPLNARTLLGVLAAFPLMTIKVIGAIHWQALLLWLKKTPIHDHPRPLSP